MIVGSSCSRESTAAQLASRRENHSRALMYPHRTCSEPDFFDPRPRAAEELKARRAMAAARHLLLIASSALLLAEFDEQCLGLSQIERIEALGEPTVDRSENFLGPPPACPDPAIAAPCWWPRVAPTTSPAARAKWREHARNMLWLSPHQFLAISRRFRRLYDRPLPHTTSPWLLPPRSWLRQCSAKLHRIEQWSREPWRVATNAMP